MAAQQVFFEDKLRELINQFSLETERDTPDFILAKYINGCLDNFNAAVKRRDGWYRFNPFDNFPEIAKKIKV